MQRYDEFLEFYYRAKEHVIEKGFLHEIQSVQDRNLSQMTDWDFLWQYTYVVLNAGMKNSIVQKIFDKLVETRDLTAVGHLGKRKAIEWMSKNYKEIYKTFMEQPTDEKKIEYLVTLPWIGSITKYHLARNLGMDVVKPDRHLVRLAKKFGYGDVLQMCDAIAVATGERVGTVDVILWRFSSLNGS